ncbi:MULTISPECIES: ADP-ribosylglycohydrolase family protein [unclassified Streptomyces]|uniref:ADP-ribosylglycohydrolase family protein n=1 Tax=unclassified Streptomyces TaxID=2593676 RepID=UPI00099F6E00|nr:MULTISPECIES: ADP-ribosylglycohydrolase family protein [unclassified Streptomyces]MCP3771576.1 ADP-ribosylglycohydrolase family protein [Streptomyces sp. MAR25Y5]
MQRSAGAVIGSAVDDALGGPFEFGPPGAFSARFPTPGTGDEMSGGGGWEPGKATDDTQMAVLVAESLLERGQLELQDIFARFQRWAVSDPKDIGLQTEAVLTNGMPWDLAAAIHFQVNQRAAGNGSLMRASTSAIHFARFGTQATMDAARRIAALTHGDRAAWESTAVFHELIRITLEGGEPLAALLDGLPLVHPDHRSRYSTVLAPGWHPDQATEFNGALWPCLGSAVWALAGSFAGRLATILGGTVWPPEAATTDVVPLTTDMSAVAVPATPSLAHCELLLPMSRPCSRLATATGLSRVRKHFAQVRRYALVSGMCEASP